MKTINNKQPTGHSMLLKQLSNDPYGYKVLVTLCMAKEIYCHNNHYDVIVYSITIQLLFATSELVEVVFYYYHVLTTPYDSYVTKRTENRGLYLVSIMTWYINTCV